MEVLDKYPAIVGRFVTENLSMAGRAIEVAQVRYQSCARALRSSRLGWRQPFTDSWTARLARHANSC